MICKHVLKKGLRSGLQHQGFRNMMSLKPLLRLHCPHLTRIMMRPQPWFKHYLRNINTTRNYSKHRIWPKKHPRTIHHDHDIIIKQL